MLGSVEICSRVTVVAAPVRLELNTASAVAVTITVSSRAMVCTVRLRSVVTPRFTMTSSRVKGSNAVPSPT